MRRCGKTDLRPGAAAMAVKRHGRQRVVRLRSEGDRRSWVSAQPWADRPPSWRLSAQGVLRRHPGKGIDSSFAELMDSGNSDSSSYKALRRLLRGLAADLE